MLYGVRLDADQEWDLGVVADREVLDVAATNKAVVEVEIGRINFHLQLADLGQQGEHGLIRHRGRESGQRTQCRLRWPLQQRERRTTYGLRSCIALEWPSSDGDLALGRVGGASIVSHLVFVLTGKE